MFSRIAKLGFRLASLALNTWQSRPAKLGGRLISPGLKPGVYGTLAKVSFDALPRGVDWAYRDYVGGNASHV